MIGMLFSISFWFNTGQYVVYLADLPNGFMNMLGSTYEFIFIWIVSFVYNNATHKKFKWLFLSLSAVYTLGGLLNLLFHQKDSLASINMFFSSLILILYSLLYFYQLMKELPAVHLHRYYMFWINSAFLFYGAGTIFLFAFTQYVINAFNQDFVNYWQAHKILYILQQVLILIGVSYNMKEIRSSASHV